VEGVAVVEELFLEEERDYRIFVPCWRRFPLEMGGINPFSLEVEEGAFRIIVDTEMGQSWMLG
jgi:hypothetical protein